MSQDQGGAPVESAPVENLESTAPVTETEADELDLDDSEESELSQDAKAEEVKQEIKELKKKLKLKIDDREIEHELDFNDEDGLKKMLQKGLAADKKMSEAAMQRKQMEQMLDFLMSNPEEALKRIGHDPEKLAAAIIERKVKELEMSPEERQRQEMQQKIAEYEAELKRIQEEKEAQEKATIEQQYANEIDNKITEALAKHSDLPKSDYTVKRIVNELIKYTKAGIDVDVEDVVEVVKGKMDNELKELLRNMSDDAYEKWLGMENIGRIRKIRKAKVKQQPVKTAQSIQDESPKAAPLTPAEKRMSMKDFFKDPSKFIKS